LKYAGLVSIVFALPQIAMKALLTLRRCQFDINCLMLSAVVGAVALQDYVEAAAVAFLFSLSEWLEVRATSRAREALSSIINLRPEKANLIHPRTKELVVVPARVVPVGATVSVRSGDKIPCDGIVIEGFTIIDESVSWFLCFDVALPRYVHLNDHLLSRLLESRDRYERLWEIRFRVVPSILATIRF
jgi:Zn2+/Cd2+-exporting ATPase